MFGSRIRSWMENHIVRPRKRNNKNKQGTSESSKKDAIHLQTNGLTTITPTTTAVISNGNTNHCVASPVRRREVSPIQNHSRYGWQSPDSEGITSPKSDNFLYAPNHHHHLNHHRFRKEPTQRYEFDPKTEHLAPLSEPKITTLTQPENSSSSFSSLSWSTGSKDPTVSVEKQQLQVPILTYQATTEVIPSQDEDPDAVHYEEIQPTTILRKHYSAPNANRDYIFQERPKSEQLTTFTGPHRQTDFIPERRSIDDYSTARYGKLLPSRIQCRGSSESIIVGSSECLPWQKPSYAGNFRLRKGSILSTNKDPTSSNNLKGGAILLHSLSSPESAYSTGYSTDGTSPGACYNQTPEYYINMRTGTHYFPKSINSLSIETQRCKFGLNKIEEMSPIDPLPKTSFAAACTKVSKYVSPHKSAQTPDARHAPVLPNLIGYESSSPRQRCRIRTNPWVSTHDSMAPLGMTFQQLSNTSTTSSTVCSSRSSISAISAQIDVNSTKHLASQVNKSKADISSKHCNGKAIYDSSSSLEMEDAKQCTMYLTEVDSSECPRTNTPNSGIHFGKRESSAAVTPTHITGAVSSTIQQQQAVAYLDASEEDATLNEMMGKFDESYVYEKETDIISDSDATNCPSALDTADAAEDAGDECDTDEYLDIDFIDTASIHEMPVKKHHRQIFEKTFERSHLKRSGSSVRRRKRLVKTRKKSTGENKENNMSNTSPLKKCRETRSVGGTPMSVRRNTKTSNERNHKKSLVCERASSLVFPHDPGRYYMTVAESNKAILKADLEADFKYRQLIQEAESILVSLKSSAQSLPRETPVSSPRRINPLMNKRVEMLKINEIKQHSTPPQPPTNHSADMEQDFSAVLNKRIERLKYESTSAPNSPRSVQRFSPRKTHITNFINQIDGCRKTSPTSSENHLINCATQPAQNRNSPLKRKSILRIDKTLPSYNFDSEPEIDQGNGKFPSFDYKMDMANHNYMPEMMMMTRIDQLRNIVYEDYTNHNLQIFESNMNRIDVNSVGKYYCPQSEPLKRKVYKGSNNFDRIKCNFDFESASSKLQTSAWLNHNQLRTFTSKNPTQDLNLNSPLLVNRKQLLLDTLSELKQNLVNQSVQLNEFNID